MSSHRLRYAVLAGVLGVTAGCAGDGPDRAVGLESRDYTFSGLDGFVGRAGEKVEFVMTNRGPADHEFEVFDPDGHELGEIEPVSTGATGKATFSLKKPGTYRFVCGVSDHEDRGMHGTFEVR
ncbi:MAG: cupredoxin domain-containing protein [Actinomycetota bacterium]|nr:cupredoxin domain-containing protein [Actinomycetota bacterium]